MYAQTTCKPTVGVLPRPFLDNFHCQARPIQSQRQRARHRLRQHPSMRRYPANSRCKQWVLRRLGPAVLDVQGQFLCHSSRLLAGLMLQQRRKQSVQVLPHAAAWRGKPHPSQRCPGRGAAGGRPVVPRQQKPGQASCSFAWPSAQPQARAGLLVTTISHCALPDAVRVHQNPAFPRRLQQACKRDSPATQRLLSYICLAPKQTPARH
mmetsp:Transcript_44191/g.87688  ORF Transcript_44191/g.87688 Transcript_44191/m.87688 type:complete len:208 (+) Transcript_44191:3-626(+)